MPECHFLMRSERNFRSFACEFEMVKGKELREKISNALKLRDGGPKFKAPYFKDLLEIYLYADSSITLVDDDDWVSVRQLFKVCRIPGVHGHSRVLVGATPIKSGL